ncbi:hypothetical protein AB0B25_04325 [Nocardia sp. NPDC049190]
MATWVATFVLYVFIRPDEVATTPTPVNTIPAAVITESPSH